MSRLRQNAGGLHQQAWVEQGLVGFSSAPSRIDTARSALEKELEDVRQVLRCGEANKEVVPTPGQVLKRSKTSSCVAIFAAVTYARVVRPVRPVTVGKGGKWQNEYKQFLISVITL